MIDSVLSKNRITIRLTDERWAHITEEHGELAGMRLDALAAIDEPDRIVLGNAGEHLAIREQEPGKYLVVEYREEENDGFIITAFLTRRIRPIDKRKKLWP